MPRSKRWLWAAHLLPYSLLVFEYLAWRFPNSFQSLFGTRKIWESLTDSAPTFLAIHIHEKSCVQCNVISAYACSRVQDTIGTDYPSSRITQDRILPVCDLLPYLSCMRGIVSADGYDSCVECSKLLLVLRELAQLMCAIGSPISAIEH